MDLCAILSRLLLPAHFRERFGRQLADAYRDGLRDRSGAPVARGRFRLRALLDLLVVALRSRRSSPNLFPHAPLPGTQRMENLLQDLRHAFRSMLRSPLPTLVSILTLAIGIGASSAMFGLVDGVLLKPLPFPESERLVLVYERNEGRGWDRFAVSPPNYIDWGEQASSFEGLAGYYGNSFTLTGDFQPERVSGQSVDHAYFRVLGIEPALGRSFAPEEALAGSNRVVILGAGLWSRRFGSDPALVGRSIQVDGEPHTVVGVLGADQPAPGGGELWKPLAMDEHASSSRGAHYFLVAGRLAEGVTLEAAREEMLALAARLPLADQGWSTTVVTFYEAMVGGSGNSLRLLSAIVGLVLLIACGNVANIMMAKFGDRGPELSMRAALGAGRARLARLVLAEGILTTGLGALLGLGLATGIVALLRQTVPDSLPRLETVSIDLRVLAFSMLCALATGLLVGLVPAWKAGRMRMASSLHSGAGAVSPRRRLATAVVVGQVALATAATLGAGLLVRSLVELQSVDPGFETADRLTFRIGLPGAAYPERRQQAEFWESLLQELGAVPGILAASGTSGLPLTSDFSIGFTIEGRPTPDNSNHSSEMRVVTDDYFASLGIPVRAGRSFGPEDRMEAPPAIVVNEAFAERFFPGENPIGQRLEVGYRRDDDSPPREIVGVVGNVRVYGLTDADRPVYYHSARQFPINTMAIIVEAATPPEALIATVRDRVARIDDQLPIYGIMTVDELISADAAGPRFRAALVASFGLLALVLASVGIYGNLAYAVLRRRREIGLRLAVGAQPGDVRRWVIGSGLRLAAFGLGLGMLGAMVAAGWLGEFLYQVDPRDPATYLGVAIVLFGVVLAACSLPAIRATRVDPVVALRND